MKILQVNKLYSPWIGGIETVAQDIAEHFHGRDGARVVNLVCQPSGARKIGGVNGVPTYRAASFGMAFGMPLSLDFFRLFKKLSADADVIILHHPFPIAFIAYRLFGKGKRVIVWYHSDIVRQNIAKAPFMPFIRAVLAAAEHILVSNEAIIKHSAVLKKFSDKCRVVRFGVDPARFRETGAIEKAEDEIRNEYGSPLILSVGRLVYYKGYSYLIDAIKDVPAHLLIVGSGPLRAALNAQIRRNGMGDKVFIVGSVDDLVPYYHACDVFALPSCEPSEMFGIVQIEAMACGKPVVNTALPTGVPEVSVDGRTGKTVPPKDAPALAEALREILSNKDEYDRFSANATREVAARFTKEKFFAEMEHYLS